MIDTAGIAELIRHTARIEVLPRFQALSPDDIREKKPGDLVTIADERMEEALTAALPAFLPGSAVLGEEAAARDPAVISRLGEPAPLWIIDPIDGTGNYAKGRPLFAVIVALVVDGVTEAGWIHDPLKDVTVTATRGGGAWRDGGRLAVDRQTPPAGAAGAAYGMSKRGLLQRDASNAQLIDETGRFGRIANHMCGATEYIALALGELHYSLHSRSLPWDHAAGALITEEAGGVTRFLDGSAYSPRILDRPILAASSDTMFDAVRDVVYA